MAMATPPRQWNTVITMIRHSVTVIRAPAFVPVPEEEEDEEGEVINEDEIEAARQKISAWQIAGFCAKRNVKERRAETLRASISTG